MQLRNLVSGLKSVHRGSDVHGRVQHLQGWMDRARAEDAGPAGYDHTETVREYYDLCTEFMTFGWGSPCTSLPFRLTKPWRNPRSGTNDRSLTCWTFARE